MNDLILVYVIVLLLIVGAVMRILLAEKKQEPLSLFHKVQRFIFPGLLLIAALTVQFDGADHIIAAVLVGLAQELIFYLIFRRKES